MYSIWGFNVKELLINNGSNVLSNWVIDSPFSQGNNSELKREERVSGLMLMLYSLEDFNLRITHPQEHFSSGEVVNIGLL